LLRAGLDGAGEEDGQGRWSVDGHFCKIHWSRTASATPCFSTGRM
jgi:hypothetical protein